MTSVTLPKRVSLRVYHGGEFKCTEGKFDYVGGGVHMQHGCFLEKVTVDYCKKLAHKLTKRDDSEIWYRRPMRSIHNANGKGELVSCFDLINFLKTRCQRTNTLTMWLTQPTTIESFASTVVEKTKSVNVGPLEKDVVVEKGSLCGTKDRIEDHTSLVCPIQLKEPIQQIPTPTNVPHSPLLPLRKSPRQHKNTTQTAPKQITKADLVSVNVTTGREKLPLRRNLNFGVQPGIVFRETNGDCDKQSGGVSGVVSGFIELGRHKKADRKGKAKVNEGIVPEFGHFKRAAKGKKITTVRKEEKKAVVRKGQKKVVDLEKGKKVDIRNKGKRADLRKGRKKVAENISEEEEFSDSEVSEQGSDDFGLNEFDLGLNKTDDLFQKEDSGLPVIVVEAALGLEELKGKDKALVEPSKAKERVLFGVDDLFVNVEADVDYDSEELRSLHGSDDDEGSSNPIFNPDHDFSKPIKLKLGLHFPSVEVFRKALVQHSVENGYDFYYSHNGRDRVTALCYNRCKCEWNNKRSKLPKCVCGVKNPCKFRVHARNVTAEIFEITGLHLKHKCAMSSYNRKVSSEYLAEKYIEFWRNNTDWKLQKFQKHVLQDLGVHVTYMRCWLARSRAKLMIHGNSKEQYAKVWDYAAAQLKYNIGSSAFVVCDNIERPPPIFKRFYVCLKACKEGFKTGCRPILGVDGCHLRGVYPGMCLVAVGIDANNNIFPIAWAVVEVENRDSWTWFLELLAADIDRVEGEGLTVMSDRQKGLIDALATVVPKANIRFCARHIWANLKLRFRGASGQLCKDTFWAAARALTRADFSKEMEGMKLLSRDAWSFLNNIPARHWSRHAFDSTCKSHLLLNNVCEVFNAVLKEAREKPILTMLEWMRKYVMQRICQRRDGVKSHDDRVMPYVRKYIDWAKDESRFATFIRSDEFEFEVELRGEQVVVNLQDRTCGCNYWNLTGLPCAHATAIMLEKRMDPLDYVDESYLKEKYILTYANKVSPMPGARHWEPTGMPEPLPPPLRSMPGRPKGKKRRKEAGEKEDQQLRMGKRSKNCSNCGGSGHYNRTCKNPTAPPKTDVRAPGGRPQKKTEWAKNIRDKAMTRAAQKEAWGRAHLNGASTSTSTSMPSTNIAPATSAPSISLSFTEMLSQVSNAQGYPAWHQS